MQLKSSRLAVIASLALSGAAFAQTPPADQAQTPTPPAAAEAAPPVAAPAAATAAPEEATGRKKAVMVVPHRSGILASSVAPHPFRHIIIAGDIGFGGAELARPIPGAGSRGHCPLAGRGRHQICHMCYTMGRTVSNNVLR